MKLQTPQKLFQQQLLQQKVLEQIFLLITMTLLIGVSFYCYLVKYQAKQKHLLPYHVTINNFKEPLY